MTRMPKRNPPPPRRSNNYMRATVRIAQNWHHVMGTFAAATFMHKAGVPLHVALRTLAGRTTACN